MAFSSMKARVRYREVQKDLEYDPNLDFDVFQCQVCSAFEFEEPAFELVDYAGRTITNSCDIMEIVDPNGSFDVWCERGISMCSRALFGDAPLVQKAFGIVDTNYNVCAFCRSMFDESLLLSSDNRFLSFVCESRAAIEFGLSYPFANEFLTVAQGGSALPEPVLLFIKRRFLYDVFVGRSPLPEALLDVRHSFESKMRGGLENVSAYEVPSNQMAARACIDFQRISEYAAAHSANAPSSSPLASDQAFLRGLMQWFKTDFFKWCNKPACSQPDCGASGGQMESVGGAPPTLEESVIGGAQRVEVYKCGACQKLTRFPRYNNPVTLLRTRMGRCGEWANAFCLICRSLSLDARWVLDFTDHVWVEVWLPSLGRYTHADPCERALDSPLMYEAGWNKKLTHILSFARHGVAEATAKYSRRLEEVVLRRSKGFVAYEQAVAVAVEEKDDSSLQAFSLQIIESGVTTDEQRSSALMRAIEAPSLAAFEAVAALGDISVECASQRRRSLSRELLGLSLLGAADCKLDELRGRLSGDEEWRRARGELREGAAMAQGETPPLQYSFRFLRESMSWSCPWLVEGLVPSASVLSGSPHLDFCLCSVGALTNPAQDDIPADLPRLTSSLFAQTNDNLLVPRACINISVGGLVFGPGHTGCNIAHFSWQTGAYLSHDNFFPDESLHSHRVVGSGSTGEILSVAATLESCTSSIAAARTLCVRDVMEIAIKRTRTDVMDIHSLPRQTLEDGCADPFIAMVRSGKDPQSAVMLADVSGRRNSQAHVVRARVFIGSSGVNSPEQCMIHRHEFVRVPGTYMCSVPSHVIFSDAVSAAFGQEGGVQRDQFLIAACRRYCEADSTALGFVLCPGPEPAYSSYSHAFIFSDRGYPLTRSKTCATFVRRVQLVDNETKDENVRSETLIQQQAAEASEKATPPNISNMIAADACVSLSSGPFQAPARQTAPEAPSLSSAFLKYVPLGGSSHSDTVVFDSSFFLWNLVDAFGAAVLADLHEHSMICSENAGVGNNINISAYLWDRLNVNKISIWAGESLVNGVSCCYSVYQAEESAEAATGTTRKYHIPLQFQCQFSSAVFMSTDPQGRPLRRDLALAPGEEIVSVTAHTGSLVDRICLRTNFGTDFQCGGNGGSPTTYTIPIGWKFCGIYGGLGGHMHNVGIVLMKRPHAASSTSTSQLPQTVAGIGSQLLAWSRIETERRRRRVWQRTFGQEGGNFVLSFSAGGTCGYGNTWKRTRLFGSLCNAVFSNVDVMNCGSFNSFQTCEDHASQPDPGMFIVLCTNILCPSLSPSFATAAKDCFSAIAAYVDNIWKSAKRLFAPSSAAAPVAGVVAAVEVTGKKLEVRLSNAFFCRTVLGVTRDGLGLALFSFGPAGYRVSACGSFFQCADLLRLMATRGEAAQRVWMDALQNYSSLMKKLCDDNVYDII